MSPNKITLIIADDHPIFRSGLRMIIDKDEQLQVVAELDNGLSAYQAIELHQPRVAVLDLDMPGISGLEIAKKSSEKLLPVSIIILTMYNEEDMFEKAMEYGVMGYILKESAVLDVIEGIKTVARGEYYLSPALTNHALKRSRLIDNSSEQRLGLHKLTASERKILRFIANEKSSKEIATELCVSPRTVEKHRANISDKLDLRGPLALVHFAIENKEYI